MSNTALALIPTIQPGGMMIETKHSLPSAVPSRSCKSLVSYRARGLKVYSSRIGRLSPSHTTTSGPTPS